jgi:tRNA-specific 2-thiouridylase
VLVSGGLDGILATRLVSGQGLRLEGVHFKTGFNLEARSKSVARAGCGVGVDVVDVTTEYFREIVLEGHGNPGFRDCRGCRRFMLRRAAAIARERGIEWLVTGDVVGQRTHGLARSDLMTLDEQAGLVGRVLRPLSARLLPVTCAESEGPVDRNRLHGLHGRSRRAQIAMARRWGIDEYPVPSGTCCRLEDPRFAPRLCDVVAHPPSEAELAGDLALLEFPRHFRLSWRAKVVLGRNERECRLLAQRACGRVTVQVADKRGSLGLVSGSIDDVYDQERAAALAARYSQSRDLPSVDVTIEAPDNPLNVSVRPATADQVDAWRI